ncbi:MAG: RHS repeat-associated core domain-containing protein, partial [Treponema sp.]|nr:RHS repeat-associated core domain-containing protein [Treponema sp.]
MTGKASLETVTPQKSIGDNLNYSFKYVYDEKYAHRLVSAGERYYKYDSNGNIVMEQDGSFEANGTEGAYHRINRETDDVYSTDYGWGLYKDSDGKKTTTRAYSRTYDWNERNLLVGSADANYTTTYVYGQDGQRSNKYTKNSETLYFNKMWTHRTDSALKVYGGQTAKNIYLGETRIVTKLNAGSNPTVQEESDKQYFYHSDHLGSASLISDCEGNEYQRIEYTPYGEIWVEKTENNGLAYLPYKFTGKEIDEETGLYYYGARYLDPKYSRWLSTDPALGEYIPKAGKGTADEAGKLAGQGGIFNSVNQSLYNYASNNPIKYSDPDGRNPISIAVCWAAAFASAATAAYFATPSGQKGLQDLAEALSYGVQAANQAVSNAINNTVECVKTNVEYYNIAKAKAKELAKEYTDRKSTGSYTITFASGKTYSGKGGVKRAIESAAF